MVITEKRVTETREELDLEKLTNEEESQMQKQMSDLSSILRQTLKEWNNEWTAVRPLQSSENVKQSSMKE